MPTRAARALKARRAKLDVKIARVKRKIKTLTRQLRTQGRILSKRQAARKKM
jgi:hypothetical protein